MKKILTMILLCMLCTSTLSVFTIGVKAESPFQVLWRAPIKDVYWKWMESPGNLGIDVGDVDGDGAADVATIPTDWTYGGGGTVNTLQVFKSDGTELWSASVLVDGGKVAIADVDLDGKGEVFVLGTTEDTATGSDALVYAFDHNGAKLWEYRDRDDYGFWAVKASWIIFANIDADPELEEIVANGEYAYLNRFTYALDTDGTLLWRFTGNEVSQLLYGDVTGDSVPEVTVLTSVGSMVYVLDKLTGNLIWSYGTVNFNRGVLGDITGDDVNDVIVSSGSDGPNELYALKNDGSLRWSKDYLSGTSNAPSIAVVEDIDNDEIGDVLLGAEQMIQAYRNDGTLLWTFGDPVFFNYVTPELYRFDIDKNGQEEIIFFKGKDIYQIRKDGTTNLVGALPLADYWIKGYGVRVTEIASTQTAWLVSGDVNDDGFDELLFTEVIDGKFYATVVTAASQPGCFDPRRDGFSFPNVPGSFVHDWCKENTEDYLENLRTMVESKYPNLYELISPLENEYVRNAFYSTISTVVSLAHTMGHCHGMTKTAKQFFMGEVALPTGTIRTYDLDPPSYWPTYGKDLQKLIDDNQNSVADPYTILRWIALDRNWFSQTEEYEAVKAIISTGTPAQVSLHRTSGIRLIPHSVLAYKVDDTEKKIYIYDPNVPGKEKYLEFEESAGSLTMKEYDPWPDYNLKFDRMMLSEVPSDITKAYEYILSFFDNLLIFFGKCPIQLHAYDSAGRHTGLNVNQEIVCEIPGSVYIGSYNCSQTIFILDPSFDTYDVNVVALGDYQYTLCLCLITDVETEVHVFESEIAKDETQQFSAEVSERGLAAYSWEYVFKDMKRGTMLKISTDDKYFQFVAPDKDFGVKHDANMKVLNHVIIICYEDDEMRLIATAVDDEIDFCSAIAKDKQTGKYCLLIDKPNWPRCYCHHFVI